MWESFEVTTNTRDAKITSNIISLCCFSLGIADHLERISFALDKHHIKIFDKKEYLDQSIRKVSRKLMNWRNDLEGNGPEVTRDMIHEFLLKQKEEKLKHVRNLRTFSQDILKLLNSKYEYLKIIFEID